MNAAPILCWKAGCTREALPGVRGWSAYCELHWSNANRRCPQCGSDRHVVCNRDADR